ncbi:MAG: hypothetical protein ACI3X9_08190, partial [Bacteroidaceae bacterium]
LVVNVLPHLCAALVVSGLRDAAAWGCRVPCGMRFFCSFLFPDLLSQRVTLRVMLYVLRVTFPHFEHKCSEKITNPVAIFHIFSDGCLKT